MPNPFNSQYPLGQTYTSRIGTQIGSNKNYVLLGFKAGFPLQASELNEFQEIFYTQQALMGELIYNWSGLGTKGPCWNGATPLSTGLLTKSSNTIILSPGWLFLKNPYYLGGMGIWAYNINTLTYTINPNINATHGITVTYSEVTATTDSELLDNSGNSRTIYGTTPYSGADRIKINITTAQSRSGLDGVVSTNPNYYPIFKTVSDGKVYTLNNYEIT